MTGAEMGNKLNQAGFVEYERVRRIEGKQSTEGNIANYEFTPEREKHDQV